MAAIKSFVLEHLKKKVTQKPPTLPTRPPFFICLPAEQDEKKSVSNANDFHSSVVINIFCLHAVSYSHVFLIRFTSSNQKYGIKSRWNVG